MDQHRLKPQPWRRLRASPLLLSTVGEVGEGAGAREVGYKSISK